MIHLPDVQRSLRLAALALHPRRDVLILASIQDVDPYLAGLRIIGGGDIQVPQGAPIPRRVAGRLDKDVQ